MTRISMKTLIAAAAVATVTGLAIAAQSGSASAKSVLACDGPDQRSLRECCETKVLKKGLPLWMRQTGKNCMTAEFKCVSSGTSYVDKRCYYVVSERDRDHKKRDERDHNSDNDTRPQ